MRRMATKQRRAARERREFTDEFKAGAVRLVLEESKSLAEVARDLDLTPSALSGWVKRAQASQDGASSAADERERAELVRLRKELREVQTERDILKKAVTFFAKESK
jgi:transposase